MMERRKVLQASVAACTFALITPGGLVHAQSPDGKSSARHEVLAARHVDDAVDVVHKIKAEPKMRTLLQHAKGIFIIPHYGRAAIGVGGSGGAGTLLVKHPDGTWSDPAFYDLGGINIGLQAGVEGGPVAMVLNNEKAVDKFMQKNNFSLGADAGITVVNWTKVAQGTAGKADVAAWSSTKGLFGNVASINVTDIRFNHTLGDAYYGRATTPDDIVHGKAGNAQADPLRQALSSISSAKK